MDKRISEKKNTKKFPNLCNANFRSNFCEDTQEFLEDFLEDLLRKKTKELAAFSNAFPEENFLINIWNIFGTRL